MVTGGPLIDRASSSLVVLSCVRRYLAGAQISHEVFRVVSVKHLQQQRPQQPLRRNRRSPYARIQLVKLRRQLPEGSFSVPD